MMKLIGKVFSVSLVLAGCASSIPPVAPPNGAVVHGNVQVSSDRRTAFFSLKNSNAYDLVCGPIYKRVVFDAPQSYLDVGETVSSDGALYFSAGQEISSEVRVSDFRNRSGGRAEVQFATFGSRAMNCRWADVRDYCDASFIDQANGALIEGVSEALLSSFNAKTCLEIAEKLEKVWFWQRADKLDAAQKEFLNKFLRYAFLK